MLSLANAQSADASCGDWLADSSSMTLHANAVSPADAVRDDWISDLTNTGRHDPEQNKSCHGPLCQNAPAPVNPPVPVQPPPSIQQWLQLSAQINAREVDGFSLTLPQDEMLVESLTAGRLDRPPCC